MKKFLLSVTALLLIAACLCAYAVSGKVTASSDMNIRSGPGLKYGSVTTLKAGKSLDYAGKTSKDSRGVVWYMVFYGSDGKVGWASSKLATLRANPSYTGKGDKEIEATGKTNLRSGPGLAYKIVGVLEKEETIEYLGVTSKDSRGVVWYKVYTYDEEEAWVSSRYVNLISVDEDPYGSTVVAEYGKTNIRKSPSLSGKKVGTLPKGESADYLDKSQTDDRGVKWYYVEYEDCEGWVSSKYTILY